MYGGEGRPGQHYGDNEQERGGQGDWPPEDRGFVDQPEAQQGQQEEEPLVDSGLVPEEVLPASARSSGEVGPGSDEYEDYLGSLGVPGAVESDAGRSLTVEGTDTGQAGAVGEILEAAGNAGVPVTVIDPEGGVQRVESDPGDEVVLDLADESNFFGAAILEALDLGEIDPDQAARILESYLEGDGDDGVQPPTEGVDSGT